MANKNIEEIKSKLLEISNFVEKLDPSMRVAAFEMLRSASFSDVLDKKKQDTVNKDQVDDTAVAPTELAKFINTYDHKKPADNILLLAAWLYSIYGVYPITAKDLKDLGNSCGLVIPGRPDNTMRFAIKSGKNLFNQQGKGWQPTVSGEIYMREVYKVKKGNKPVPKKDEK